MQETKNETALIWFRNDLRVNDNLVEFLIPVTILITAIFNLFQKDFKPKSLQLNYFFALFFGLIHGMGFANSIRFMLEKNESIGLRHHL